MTIIDNGKIEIDFHLEEKVYLEPEKIAIMMPNQVHQTKPISLKTLGYYGLHIDLDWYKCKQKKLFGIDNILLDMETNLIEDKDIYEELKSIFIDINLNNKPCTHKLEDKIINILKMYTSSKTKTLKEENSFLLEIEKYILNNINEQLTLKDISQKVGYNESYITRIFKKKHGLTPHAFIINKKINKVKNELQKSKDISISQLSHTFGFYDQSHLNKVFKRMHGTSPNKYRK